MTEKLDGSLKITRAFAMTAIGLQLLMMVLYRINFKLSSPDSPYILGAFYSLAMVISLICAFVSLIMILANWRKWAQNRAKQVTLFITISGICFPLFLLLIMRLIMGG